MRASLPAALQVDTEMRSSIGMLVAFLFANALVAAGAENKQPPNILFAIADDWGFHAGAYGTKWIKTPNFDRVAHDGLLFKNAYTPNAKCAPSRASILTGRNPWQLKEAANHIPYFPIEFKTWAEALTEHDWFVGYTQKGWAPGVAKNAAGKPRAMTGKAFNKRKAAPPTTDISDNDYAANFDDFLDAAPQSKPWCFWYGSVEPHRGYEYGSGVSKGGKKLSDINHVPEYWPDNDETRNDLLDYAFEVEHFDRHLGRMLQSLEKRGLLQNTLVIVTSDNGMPFPRSKGNTNVMANHLPLAAMWPGGIAKPGRTVDDFVSFIDLAPTFVELAGLEWSETGMADATGKSLTDIFFSSKSGTVTKSRDHVLIGRERNDIGRPHDQGYPVRGIVTSSSLYLENFEPDRWPAGNPETGYLDCDSGRTKSLILAAHRASPNDVSWAYCFGKRPRQEYYNLAADPDFMKNLADDATSAETMQRLRTQLLAELKQQSDPRIDGQGALFDNYLHAKPGHVGFYERYLRGEVLSAEWVNKSDFEKPPVKP